MNELLRRMLNLPEQASTYAAEVDHLHYFVIGVTMLGSLGVFSVALYFVLRYRRRPGDGPTPRVKGSVWMEAGIIVSILTLFIGIWIVGFKQFLRMQDPPDDAMPVYVTGKQWMWKFAYPQGPSSVGVLYVPANRPVKLIITSRDVIHSFYVPAFRMKKDAVPGRYTLAWFEANRVGTFPIRCAQYCGARHSGMLGDVVVLDPADFQRWISAPGSPVSQAIPGANADELGGRPTFTATDREALVSRGERAAADYGCLRCHTIDGTPHIGPTWTGLFGKTELLQGGLTVHVDEAYITESMMDPMAKMVVGYQPVMPSYLGRIEPGETAAIIEFIKTLEPTGLRALHPNPIPDGGVISP
jgi:cytochrome c oxidase subunit 2